MNSEKTRKFLENLTHQFSLRQKSLFHESLGIEAHFQEQ